MLYSSLMTTSRSPRASSLRGLPPHEIASKLRCIAARAGGDRIAMARLLRMSVRSIPRLLRTYAPELLSPHGVHAGRIPMESPPVT